MLLVFACHLVMLYICAKFHEINLNGIKVIEGTRFLYGKLQTPIIPQKYRWKNIGGEPLFISAHRLVMLYITTKFCEIISNGIKVIERT